MFDIAQSYQASAFIDASKVQPTPETISKLLTLFSDKGFLPSTFQEISPNNPFPQTRLALSTPTGGWRINFASNRVDFEKHPTDIRGSNLGDPMPFIEDVRELSNRVFKHLNKKAKRITFLSGGMLAEMGEVQLASIYKNLFNSLPYYSDNPSFEWSQRIASNSQSKIGKKSETLNVITQISRVMGQFVTPDSVRDFSRIEIKFDINTSANNDENRFGAADFKLFLTGALKLREDLIKQIQGRVYE